MKTLFEILERPLCIFDIEATGLNVATDRIISLAIKLIHPNGMTSRHHWYVNPGRPIPPESTRIHKITDADVARCPAFAEIASSVMQLIQGADVGGYNLIKFDVPMLWEEFNRVGLEWNLEGVRIVDASEIFQKKEPRNLAAALLKYAGREHVGAHDAADDVAATLDVLEGQRKFYPDLGEMDIAGLAAFSDRCEWEGEPAKRLDLAGYVIQDAKGIARYTLQKVRGVAVADEPGFGVWMLRNDFPAHTKRVLRELLDVPGAGDLL